MQNHDELEKMAEVRAKKREKKKGTKMKVSGGNVKKLQRIIGSKKS